MRNEIKYGIVGAGHLGNFHAQQISKIKGAELVGVFDLIKIKSDKLCLKHHTKSFKSLSNLLVACDAVSICTPAINHFNVAKQALLNNCHVFIEKPLTDNIRNAETLLKLENKTNKKIQVGHIERFNGAYTSFVQTKPLPLFIESHRLSPFNVRGLDVPVVLDLMIHDIDLILSLVKSEIKSIKATGACVISNLIDLANARIEFKNGSVANITSSRVSNKQMRKMRIFEKNAYAALNFQTQTCRQWIVKKNHKVKEIDLSKKPVNALYEELKSFIVCITNNIKIIVDSKEGYNALLVASTIQKIIGKNKK